MRVAMLWSLWLSWRGDRQSWMTAKDVAVMMALLKLVRMASDIDHRDSRLDIIGYMACLEEIIKQD